MQNTILRFPSVQARTGIPRSSTYSLIQRGLFPRPITLGPRTAGWPAHEVDALSAAWIAGKSEDEIRALVRKLESARASAS